MKTIFKYKSGYIIKQNKAGNYIIYSGKLKLNYEPDDLKDARFYVWCMTH
jgi:hypothetical protein